MTGGRARPTVSRDGQRVFRSDLRRFGEKASLSCLQLGLY